MSEQDLAHYLVTSRPSAALDREPTTLLHSSLSAEWSQPHLSEIFDRGGFLTSSCGDMTAPPATAASEPSLRLLCTASRDLGPAQSHSDSDASTSASASRPGSSTLPYRLPTVTMSTSLSESHFHNVDLHGSHSPALHPLPTSLLRVNVNTKPRLPIQLPPLPLPHILTNDVSDDGNEGNLRRTRLLKRAFSDEEDEEEAKKRRCIVKEEPHHEHDALDESDEVEGDRADQDEESQGEDDDSGSSGSESSFDADDSGEFVSRRSITNTSSRSRPSRGVASPCRLAPV
ncbi:hypothetical protein DFH06DRAFT_1319287 [Mycena polygramma]|nr:hypothetical protein DFH06DRAFT_1319287 [Mycena polygramma]